MKNSGPTWISCELSRNSVARFWVINLMATAHDLIIDKKFVTAAELSSVSFNIL